MAMADSQTPTTTVCVNPCTGDVLGESPLNTVEDVRRAVRQAREAQPAWAKTPVSVRAEKVRKIRDYFVSHVDELTALISADSGKTRTDAMITEIFSGAMGCDYYARMAGKWLKERGLRAGNFMLANKKSKIIRVPYGVIGIIAPWNYPLAIPVAEVIMGLLAGNAVILKGASETQMVCRALEKAIQSAGFPEGVFTHLNLPGRIAGDAFLESGVDKLFFTGSVAVGKTLMRKAADTLTPVCLELGGNDPMLVFPDADLERAAAGAVWAGMQNCGQSCGGVERIYVHERVYDAFLEKLTKRVKALRVGNSAGFDHDLGVMTTARQKEAVQRQVREALDLGAVLHVQSPCEEFSENALPAMVLTGVTHSMSVMREETFGPVVGVMKVADMDTAVTLANDSNLGLTASVWSKDRKTAEGYARRIKAGVVMINDHLMSHGLHETPWGGFKESGPGRSHGDIGFLEMTQPQCIVDELFPVLRRNMFWYPHGQNVYDGIKGFLDMLYSGDISTRAAGLKAMAKTFMRSFFVG